MLAYFVWSCYSAGWMRYSPRTSQKTHGPHWLLWPAKQCRHVTVTLFKLCGHINEVGERRTTRWEFYQGNLFKDLFGTQNVSTPAIYCRFRLFKWLASMTGTVFPYTTQSNYKIVMCCNKAVPAKRLSLSEWTLEISILFGKWGITRSFVQGNLTLCRKHMRNFTTYLKLDLKCW